MEMDEKPPIKNIGKELKISRINPDNIRPITVNDVVIAHTRAEFFFIFSSIEPPIVLEEQAFDNLQDINAITRVKLVVTPEFAKALLKALEVNIEQFEKEKR
jgi:hypothetical protein